MQESTRPHGRSLVLSPHSLKFSWKCRIWQSLCPSWETCTKNHPNNSYPHGEQLLPSNLIYCRFLTCFESVPAMVIHGFLFTDLYKYKFIDCETVNVSYHNQKKGCQLNFEEDDDFLIYLVSFLGSLSVLPGNIISALLMDKLGRIKMIGERGMNGTKGEGWTWLSFRVMTGSTARHPQVAFIYFILF